MAVAFRSAGTPVEALSASSVTVSYTLTAGDLLVVMIEAGAASVPSITSVVWNGSENMTLVGTITQSSFRTNWTYALMGATSGTHNIVVTIGSSVNVAAAVAFGYSGVSTTTPWDTGTVATGAAFSTAPSTTLSGGQAGDLVVTTGLASEATTSLTMTNGTKRSSQATANVTYFVIDQPSAASVTTNGTGNTNDGWSWVSFNLNVAPTTAIKTFNGLVYASTKTVKGLAIASVKTFNGLT
jgi:hypothetical protein